MRRSAVTARNLISAVSKRNNDNCAQTDDRRGWTATADGDCPGRERPDGLRRDVRVLEVRRASSYFVSSW